MLSDHIRKALTEKRIADPTFFWDESHVSTLSRIAKKIMGDEEGTKASRKAARTVVDNITGYNQGRPVVKITEDSNAAS